MLSRKSKQRMLLGLFVFNRDNGCCYYCGTKLFWDKKGGKQRKNGMTNELYFAILKTLWTLDHVVPKVNGGSSAKHNLVLSCELCNRIKGNSLVHPITKECILEEKVCEDLKLKNEHLLQKEEKSRAFETER